MSWISKKQEPLQQSQTSKNHDLNDIQKKVRFVLELDNLKDSPVRFFKELANRYFFKDKNISSKANEISSSHQRILDYEKYLWDLECKWEKKWNKLTLEEKHKKIERFI